MTSPDGIIVNERAIIEIKCPFVFKDLHPSEAIVTNKVKYASLLHNGQLSLKKKQQIIIIKHRDN